jgi:hypothetical protein
MLRKYIDVQRYDFFPEKTEGNGGNLHYSIEKDPSTLHFSLRKAFLAEKTTE